MSKVYLNTFGGIGGHGITLYNGCNSGDFFIYGLFTRVGNMTVSYLITRCLTSLNYDDIFLYCFYYY